MSSRDRFAAYRRALPRPPRLTRHTVRARGLDFAVFMSPAVEGATPLVCINGGLLYDHRLLWPALSPLAAARQVVLYDQRGRGASQPPPGIRAARIEHDAGDVGALREALGIARWDVLGHSWGGGIAMLAAAADPAGTRRLVLVNAVGTTSEGWLDELHERALERLDDPGRDALDRASDAIAEHEAVSHGTGDPALLSDYQAAIYPAWFADRELAALFNPPRSTSRTGAAVSARLRRAGYDWRETLRAVTAPTLVIHGESDLLPPAVARATAALLGAELALIPDAGHMPFWEAPPRFFALVEEFLRR
ncbi:MAG TPA: alpha/beta fold hydrolase [Gemmatimonadaceae bacterium]|nr:alpha/beta fold hydrolase [Gemmatimonadaceae bacterium]